MRSLAAILLALAITDGACAHDSYFLPRSFVSQGPSIDLPFTSAEAFPALEYGPKKERVASTSARGADRDVRLSVVGERRDALNLRLTARKSGLYVAAISLAPHPITLSPEKVEEYLAEIGADRDTREAYDALPAPRVWRELYTKYAKTLVCIGTCAGRRAARDPLGFALEFVVAEKPGCAGRAFQLLSKGRAAAGRSVSVATGKDRRLLRTDASGTICLPPGIAGPTLLSAVIIRINRGKPFTSDFATMTFDMAGWEAR